MVEALMIFVVIPLGLPLMGMLVVCYIQHRIDISDALQRRINGLEG
jgi:hypothetical protein